MRPRLPRRSTRALHASASARLVSCTLYGLTSEPREEEAVDACIVGGGPAGLSAAIHLEQLELDTRNEVRVVVLGRAGDMLRNALAEIRHHDPAPTAHEQQQRNHIASLSRGHRRRNGRFIPGFAGAPSPLPRTEHARRAREQGAQ
ncbi:hypothetical protein K438DRAFT_1852802, partial [Mycena galopus ATCC 62051]